MITNGEKHEGPPDRIYLIHHVGGQIDKNRNRTAYNSHDMQRSIIDMIGAGADYVGVKPYWNEDKREKTNA